MIDILVYLFARYADYESRPEAESLVRKLKAAGFEDADISSAVRWLSALKQSESVIQLARERSDSFRVWSAQERVKLDIEGLDFISFLEHAGVLTPDTRELIVDRVLALDETPVALAKLKVVTLMVLWSQEGDLESLLIEELLTEPGQAVH